MAAAGRHFGVDEESIADLKLAVSEACTQVIEAHRRTGLDQPVHIVLEAAPGSLHVEVAAESAAFDPAPAAEPDLDQTPVGLGRALSTSLIHSLFPDAEFSSDVPGISVRFSLPRTPEA